MHLWPSLCAHTLSFLLGIFHEVEYLGDGRGVCYKINAILFPKMPGICYGLHSVAFSSVVQFFFFSPLETFSLTCGLFKSSLFRFQVFETILFFVLFLLVVAHIPHRQWSQGHSAWIGLATKRPHRHKIPFSGVRDGFATSGVSSRAGGQESEHTWNPYVFIRGRNLIEYSAQIRQGIVLKKQGCSSVPLGDA